MQTEEPLHIRGALPTDAPALAALLRRIGWWDRLNTEDPETTAERLAAQLVAALANELYSVYVVENDGALLGYAAVHWLNYLFLQGPEGYISELFVDPNGQGQGIGGRLLAHVQEAARRRGCVRLSLLNGKARPSYARGFYRKQGWEERTQMANFVLYLA